MLGALLLLALAAPSGAQKAERAGGVKARVASLERSVTELTKQIGSDALRIAALESSLSTTNSAFDSLENDLFDLEAGVDALETMLSNQDFESLEADVNAITTDIYSLKTRIGIVETDMGSVDYDIGTLKSKTSKLDSSGTYTGYISVDASAISRPFLCSWNSVAKWSMFGGLSC